ncbi:hypothetical protein ASPWEDRAFT_663611 [Aspergillus wentii DTO 134E9]|uniref:Uncharacterized protein n=1 Tax=Aspergillus wentii DTO 134E9 TaxID=1073089 RepID=A0A1L9RBY3_ASPWE|nr:uncharacterized protein ASPWEDRAFT_663611 [Aspergillus wentii DTO 134E9]KAI9934979.1 hypothetical protein MW887_000600 [Aspergillus wentii]OJJ32422.1 hypothetical protein ASPWEDRAFT_663611 [Aspergillus wentii DTO 134E9]
MPVTAQSSTQNPTLALRDRLNTLSAEISSRQSSELLDEGALSDNFLRTLQIECILFDFEQLDSEDAKLSLEPPVLLRPISLEIAEKHPIDPKYESLEDQKTLEFRDYNPPKESQEFKKNRPGALKSAQEVSRFTCMLGPLTILWLAKPGHGTCHSKVNRSG